jgi:delta1-piperideine-2-carboxylate reductase
MPDMISVAELADLVAAVFTIRGMFSDDARTMAGVIVAAERDGTLSHGLQRMRGYVSSMDAGWADPRAKVVLRRATPAVLLADAGNGFAQIALAPARGDLMSIAREQGVAVLATRNSHHFAALWPDIEPFAAAGLIAITMVNTRPWMIAWDGTRRVLGTNPVAFACPRAGTAPVVWDQASSTLAQGEVLRHARAERPLPVGTGVDANGMPCTDAATILNEGALLPFAGAKGSSIAFMVEILAAAFGGGRFGFEDISAAVPGAVTSNTGQFLMLLDPGAASDDFAHRVEAFLDTIIAGGSARLPGDRRCANRRRAERDGIAVSCAMLDELRDYARK